MNCSPEAGAMHNTSIVVLSFPTEMDVVVPNLNGLRPVGGGEDLRIEDRLV